MRHYLVDMTHSHPPDDSRTPRKSAGSYEDRQRALDPHREEELQGVEAEVASRLRRRGVALTGHETPEEMADLLDAVERFEAAVEAHGGDLFVDTPTSGDRASQPDNPLYVLPRRESMEPVEAYVARLRDATSRVRRADH